MEHEAQIMEKKLKATMQDLEVDYKAKLAAKERELGELDALKMRLLEQAAADYEKDLKDKTDKLIALWEAKLLKAQNEALEAQEIAVAAVVMEKEALLAEKAKMEEKIAAAELAAAALVSKEENVENYLNGQNQQLKRELADTRAECDKKLAKA